MKTNVINESKSSTRKNTILLLAVFFTPILLFGILITSMLNSDSSAVNDINSQKYAVDNVYFTGEMFLVPKTYTYDQIGDKNESTISLNKDHIRYRDALLPNIGRY